MEPGGVALLAGACAVAACLPGAREAGATAVTWPSTGESCIVIVEAGDSLSLIADGIPDPAVTAGSLQAENGIDDADVIEEGDALDVCVGNGINDVTGGAHQPDGVAADATGVEAQQRKLNELFSGLGIPELAVDGDSGPLTRQQLCAARLALDLPISRADMAPGSDEEKVLMAATALPIPANAAAGEARWILIDKTCQVLFAGETGTRLTFVFGTSTGRGRMGDPQPRGGAGVSVRPGARERRVAQQHDVPGRCRQPAQRQHVPAAVLLSRPGDPRLEQRPARAAEQGLSRGCASRIRTR